MAENTSILLLSGIVSGIISIFVNIVSILFQNKLQKQRDKDETVHNWQTNVLSLSKQIRRECINIEYNVDLDPESMEPVDEPDLKSDLEFLSTLVSDLEAEHDSAPVEMLDSDTISQIRKAVNWYRNPQPSKDEFSTNDLKREFIPRIESIMDELYETSDRIDTVPY